MPLGYRTIFTVDAGRDPLHVAAEQFRSWLRQKRYDADAITPGVHHVADGALLAVTEFSPLDGSRALRYRLTEATPKGEWTTTITARSGGRDPDWIWVDVTAPPYQRADEAAIHGVIEADEDVESADDPAWTAVPRLVRDILSVTGAHDGDLFLSERPSPVGADELDGLIAAVCDPDRRGSALVAAPIPGVAMPLLISHVEQITRQCVGLAGVYVLDEAAAKELEGSFGQLHAVPLGAIRTYLPGVDPASAVDARRHRILMASTIATQPAPKLARSLGWVHRSRALNLPLPKQISRVDRILSREEPVAALRSIHEGAFTASADRTGWPERPAEPDRAAPGRATEADDSEAVQEATQITIEAAQDVEARADLALRGQRELSRRVAGLQDRLEEAEDERHMALGRLEDEQLDHAETQYELLRVKAEADRLRAALAASGRPHEAWAAPAEPEQSPGSFAELLERLRDGALPRISFTGEAKHAFELDAHDPLGTWAAKTWDILRVLDGYVEARQRGEFSNGVHPYLTETPPGRPRYSPGAHASQESDTVENSPKFQRLRMLPVPAEVSADGNTFMGAHFRIAKKGLISPRMHYHDDAARTGRIYVGYIGRHLPNKQTN
jgi:hypothetical protein